MSKLRASCSFFINKCRNLFILKKRRKKKKKLVSGNLSITVCRPHPIIFIPYSVQVIKQSTCLIGEIIMKLSTLVFRDPTLLLFNGIPATFHHRIADMVPWNLVSWIIRLKFAQRCSYKQLPCGLSSD